MRILKIHFLFFNIVFFALISCTHNSTPDNDIVEIANDTVQEPEDAVETNTRIEDSILRTIGMIRIIDSLPRIIVDIKYATTDNFLGFDFYNGFQEAYIRPECLKKLKNAYNNLCHEHPDYTFVIFDAARSIESQQLMWDSLDVPLSRKHWYVANPQKGSIHNYGMAIDISIADTDGNYLDMGTDFDYFGDLAFPGKSGQFLSSGELTKEQYDNRELLMSIMKSAGFSVSTTEWWHYNATSLNFAKDHYPIYSISGTDK